MTKRFSGKTALITGAANGIGAETARQFASEGAKLVLLDRSAEDLEIVGEECRDLGAPVVTTANVDQRDHDAVAGAVEAGWEASGRIDVLFANAGFGRFDTFLNTTPRTWAMHVDVNINGTFNVCHAVASRMASDGGGGAVVINASTGAKLYTAQLPAYCVTKASLPMLATAMASELGVHRIRVNCVLPGVVETAMTGTLLADEAHRGAILSDTPAGRLGRPEDVAQLVCFLASDDATFITGAALTVDGGQTIHGHPRWYKLDQRYQLEERWGIPG